MNPNSTDIFLVTGGSGYVGKLLLQRLICNPRVDRIIVVDKDNLREDLKNNPKVVFIQKNLVDDHPTASGSWEVLARNFNPTKVVHLAWQIRTMYGKEKLQNNWNIGGSQRVFEFVKNTPSVKAFIHFSTVASYGALPTNSFQDVFTEDKPFRKTNYLYAEEKRMVEENLDKIFETTPAAPGDSSYTPGTAGVQVFVIRPASIAGPSGRERTGFGLQSALAGKIVGEGWFQKTIFNFIKKFLSFMPATHGWARQFVHEDDIVNAVLTMSFSEPNLTELPSPTNRRGIQKYNLCPHYALASRGKPNYIDSKEMGEILNKKVVYLHPQVVRILCFLAWHLTLGKVPTSRGVWKAYSYPIIVDGSKIERDFPEFKYQKDIREAYKS